MGNVCGDRQFEGVFWNQKTKKTVICRCNRGYFNVHFPRAMAIDKKSSKSITIDLMDGAWSFDQPTELADIELLYWIYTPKITSEAIDQDIYLERIFSKSSKPRDQKRPK